LSSSFWPKNWLLKWNTHPVPLIWLHMTSGFTQKIKSALKGRRFQDNEDIHTHTHTHTHTHLKFQLYLALYQTSTKNLKKSAYVNFHVY
jgi:hypothetical protein